MGLGFKICEDTVALGRSIGDYIRALWTIQSAVLRSGGLMQTSVHLGALLRIDSWVAMVGARKVVRSWCHKSRE